VHQEQQLNRGIVSEMAKTEMQGQTQQIVGSCNCVDVASQMEIEL
jgi:hypothetical protein